MQGPRSALEEFHVSQQPSSPDYPGSPAASGQPGGYDQSGGYPQQGGYDQSGGYTPPSSYPPAPAPPPRKSGPNVAKIILSVIVVLVVIVGGIYFLVKRQSAPASTQVGDCMSGQTAEALKKIACTDGKAEWKVVGRVGNKTESETTVEDTCTQWPDTEVVYWEGEKGKKGFALCLAPTKK
jgi:hypothetical protein